MTIKLLTSHASVRKYKDVYIIQKELHEIIRAGQHAASSNFVQAYSVIHVTEKEKREELAHFQKIQGKFYPLAQYLYYAWIFIV